MAGRMNRLAPIAGLLVFAAGAAFAQVPTQWSLTSLVGGDSAMQTIVASGSRVFGASATRLYQTSETALMSGAFWKRVWSDGEKPTGPVRALLASPTAHFIWIGDAFYFCDSALASVPKGFSGVPCCAQAAGEDSARFYLRYSRDSILAANKADLAWHALHPGAQDTASDDLGRTRAIDRPFLPKAVFRGARVEGRGSLLCWPDPTYRTAPKPWREFPQPIREIWTVRDKLAVRAGSTLYVVDSAGGAWSEKILPADSVTLARLYGFEPLIKPAGGYLAGFTANAIWTPKDYWGGGWQPAQAQIQGQSSPWLGAGPKGTWSGTGDGKLIFHLTDGRAGVYAWDSLNSTSGYRYAEGGSYVAVAAVMGYGKLDTFNIEDLAHGVSRPPSACASPTDTKSSASPRTGISWPWARASGSLSPRTGGGPGEMAFRCRAAAASPAVPTRCSPSHHAYPCPRTRARHGRSAIAIAASNTSREMALSWPSWKRGAPHGKSRPAKIRGLPGPRFRRWDSNPKISPCRGDECWRIPVRGIRMDRSGAYGP